MKNITKIILAIVSLSFVGSYANAGELTVTGSAKATYTILSSGSTNAQQNTGKGLGVANEFNLGASGELDNGWKWTYNQNIDDATVQDDAGLKIETDMGTVAINVSQGGLSAKYGFDASAYGVGSDNGYGGGDTSSGASANTMQYGKNLGSYNNIQYATPAGMLPFGISFKAGYSPNAVVNQNASSHATGAANDGAGDTASEYAISAAPIDGLSIGASYFNLDGEAGVQQGYESGSAYAKYKVGPVTIGYGETLVALNTAGGSSAYTYGYTNKAYSLGFAVNDNLSLSYTSEKSNKEAKLKAAATGATTRSDVEMQMDTIQAAYTMGGMTVSVSSKDVDNDSYSTNKKVSETILAIAMAF
jgi:hypothetical protein